GISRWSYRWQAPDEGVGSITFYLAALEANNDLAETGDHVYTLRKTIAGEPVGVAGPDMQHAFNLYPVPAEKELYIGYVNRRPEQVTLYTVSGQKILTRSTSPFADSRTVVLDIQDVDPGVYLAEIRADESTRVLKKVFIR